MQTLILNHYPPVIKQIKEMQQIAKAEDIEFSKLNISINEVIRNMFVFTANETGVQRFEKLLGIRPKPQKLNDRKLYIISAMNKHRMSLSELEKLLQDYAEVRLSMDCSEGVLTVKTGDSVSNTGILFRILDDFMQLNVFIIFVMEIDADMNFYKMPITLEMETTIYLRGNTADAWFLDGSVLLDGSRLLDAVLWRQQIGLELETTAQMAKETFDTELTAQKDLWFLDGSVLLDGSRLLDAEFYEEVI